MNLMRSLIKFSIIFIRLLNQTKILPDCPKSLFA
jgi:hypothetical protein